MELNSQSLPEALAHIEDFQEQSLSVTIAGLENALMGLQKNSIGPVCTAKRLDANLLESAVTLKRAASQINVIIHAVGIVVALPHILEEGEIIESVSLGAATPGERSIWRQTAG
jgi:hypothetical protein